MEKEIPILYKRKEECCGCTACHAICPKDAISMVEDEEGFEYPHEYSCAVTPQIRQAGNRLSGLAETAYASLLA